MYKFIFKMVDNQVKFFTYYFIIVFVLILWSYIEGVGDIQGDILIDGKILSFKAGYFSSLNYGIYYIFFLPLFIKFFFETYRTAELLSNLNEEIDQTISSDNNLDVSQDDKHKQEFVIVTIKNYTSKITTFLKNKYSIWIFFFLVTFFSIQNIVVEKNDYKKLSLGWVQGIELKNKFHSNHDSIVIKKSFYFRKGTEFKDQIQKIDSVRVTNMSFASTRTPGKTEFVFFVVFAKLFFSLFTSFVFFFNINMLISLVLFFKESEEHKKILFASEDFVSKIDRLVSNISLSGFFLTIFCFLRYIANSQKGSFKYFNWSNILSNDQYIFLLGMMFIPITSIILFVYVVSRNLTLDFKTISVKKWVNFYVPNMAFLFVFLVYLLNFDPWMYNQLRFLTPLLDWINKGLVGK